MVFLLKRYINRGVCFTRQKMSRGRETTYQIQLLKLYSFSFLYFFCFFFLKKRFRSALYYFRIFLGDGECPYGHMMASCRQLVSCIHKIMESVLFLHPSNFYSNKNKFDVYYFYFYFFDWDTQDINPKWTSIGAHSWPTHAYGLHKLGVKI